MLIPLPISIQPLFHPILVAKSIELAVMRLDLIHAGVSGNKFFKLRYNLSQAQLEKKTTLLTFGGAYSNHIYATAEAAKATGFGSIGIVRGEPTSPLNPTLAYAQSLGMKLIFIDRASYRTKTSPSFLADLKDKLGDFYLIPEGGTNELAIKGTSEILAKSTESYTHIGVSIGTGGTFAGMASSLLPSQHLIGFSSLKGDFIHSEIDLLLSQNNINPRGILGINNSYHFGGYGKYTSELVSFIWDFYQNFGIVTDPIYTGKLAFGIWDMIQKDKFPPSSKILLIHSGGLQGNAGFTERTGIKLPIL
jgi:1-aminocyclopropane-1-carboxylate deaminase